MIRRLIKKNPTLHRLAVRTLRTGRRLGARSHVTEATAYAKLAGRRLRRGAQDRPQVRFVLYGQGRSGSSLLMDLLRSHPDVFCDGEIFSTVANGHLIAPGRYLDALCTLSAKPVYGCKVKIYQMTAQPRIGDPAAFLHDLHESGWKFVHLVRRDLFRKSLSLVVTRYRNGRFIERAGEGAKSLDRMHIDPLQVVEVMRDRQEADRSEKEALGSIPHVTITYEDDLLRGDRHGRTTDLVFDFLGVSRVPVSTRMLRTSRDRLSDYIVNAEDLVRVVRENGFEVSPAP